MTAAPYLRVDLQQLTMQRACLLQPLQRSRTSGTRSAAARSCSTLKPFRTSTHGCALGCQQTECFYVGWQSVTHIETPVLHLPGLLHVAFAATQPVYVCKATLGISVLVNDLMAV